ncbi:MAG: AI-2E family transporter [Clostridia bacterium]|nr:AI-2E family transporter [Clostridia bacterium]
MKKLKQALQTPWAAYTFAACCAVLLYMLLSNISGIGQWLSGAWKLISPIVIGIAIAYLLDPVAAFFQKKVFYAIKKESARHTAAVLTTVICLVLVLAVLLVALVPSLIKSISKLISSWDVYTQKLQQLVDRLIGFAQKHHLPVDPNNLSNLLERAMSKLFATIKNNVQPILSVVGGVGSSVLNFLVGVLFGVCFMFAKKNLLNVVAKLRAATLPQEQLERNNALWRRCHVVFVRYIGCTLVDALIIGIGTLVFTLVMQMPYAPLIAAVVGITNIIPTFGPLIGGAIGIFFLILDKPLNALLFLIFICVWQGVDGMIIKPRLFSGSLGIPAVWTLVLIILGGKAAGVLGILFAIPVAAICVILYNETVAPRLERRIAKINAAPEDAQAALADPPDPSEPPASAPEA